MYHMHANIWFSHVNIETEVQYTDRKEKSLRRRNNIVHCDKVVLSQDKCM